MSILNDDQIRDIRDAHGFKPKVVSSAALRKRAERARAKAKKAAVSDETPEGFWKRNRDVANQDRIAELRERETYVLALLDDIAVVLEGRAPDDEFVADVEEEVKADVATHGFCQIEIYFLDFWKSSDVFAMLTQRQDATSTFARYGIVTAIPEHRLHEWQQFLARKKPAALPVPAYVMLTCSCGLTTAASTEVAQSFMCQQCALKQRNSNRAITKALAVELRLQEDTILDSWGRVKDQ